MSTKPRQKKTRKYRKAKSSRGMLHGLSQPQKEVGNSILLSFIQMLLAGGVGGAIGSAIGRHSLLPGLVVAGVGNYMGNPYVTSLGMGIGLANGFQAMNPADKAVSGLDPNEGMEGFSLEEAKSRGMNYFKNFAQKLYLDKVMPPADTPPVQPVNGLGEVNYFIYPHDSQNQPSPLELNNALNQLSEAELDAFIQQQEAIVRNSGSPMNGLGATDYVDAEGRII